MSEHCYTLINAPEDQEPPTEAQLRKDLCAYPPNSRHATPQQFPFAAVAIPTLTFGNGHSGGENGHQDRGNEENYYPDHGRRAVP